MFAETIWCPSNHSELITLIDTGPIRYCSWSQKMAVFSSCHSNRSPGQCGVSCDVQHSCPHANQASCPAGCKHTDQPCSTISLKIKSWWVVLGREWWSWQQPLEGTMTQVVTRPCEAMCGHWVSPGYWCWWNTSVHRVWPMMARLAPGRGPWHWCKQPYHPTSPYTALHHTLINYAQLCHNILRFCTNICKILVFLV